ncbi:MAG TPA: vWA domain-containing protein [Gemmataceae bacterium]|nr:vWA domain-containing protein [Gemmataceae bacterium]
MRTRFVPGPLVAAAAALLWLGWAAAPGRADLLFPNLAGSHPPDESPTPINPQPVESGRKGFRFLYRYTNDAGTMDIPGGFPLDVSGATVKVQIGMNAEITAVPGINPPANGASFVADNDAVKIYFGNGNLPANTVVTYYATGVKAKTGVAQSVVSPPGPDKVRFLSGTNTPRPPVNVELVFDISGSMASPPIAVPKPGDPATRIAALQQAAQTFLMLFGKNAWLGDKVGVVYFSTGPTVFNLGVGPSNMVPGIDQDNVKKVLLDILARSPGGSTSIGAGLKAANDSGFTKEPAGARKIVVLFSDGEQNTPENVQVVGSNVQVSDKMGMNWSNYVVDRIIPVTAGDISAPGNQLQTQIGNALNGGQSYHVLTGQDLTSYFTSSLADVLVGDKWETVRDVTGSLDRNATAQQKFLANSGDVGMNIVLTWAAVVPPSAPGGEPAPTDPRVTPPLFKLTAPDGTVIDTRSSTQYGRNLSVTTLSLPQSQGKKLVPTKGEWTIDVPWPDTGVPKLNYHLIVMLDNPTLATDFILDAKDVGTGEAVPVRAKLREKGAPVLNAAVIAEMLGPTNGQGNVVSTTPTPSGAPNYGGDTIRSDAQKKLLLLLQDPTKAALFGTAGLPQLTLQDGGSGGDYSASFTGADKEGHYRLQITSLGKSSQGDYQRTRIVTFFARPKADKSKTSLVLLPPGANPQVIALKVTPKDAGGNFLGPDYLGLLKVSSSEGTAQQPLADKLDGSYEISYQLPSPSSNPTITVSVGPTTVLTTTLNDLKGGGGNGGGGGGPGGLPWWVWLLIVLAVLVLLLFLLASRGPKKV